jgi:hypothetical protein
MDNSVETGGPDGVGNRDSSDVPLSIDEKPAMEVSPDVIVDTVAEKPPAEVGPPDAPIGCAVEMVRTGVAFKATSLGPTGGLGVCSFPPARLSTTRYYAALDGRLLRAEIACGACIRVSTANGSVTLDAQIIDAINITVPADRYALGLDASAHAAFGSTGNPELAFKYVPCDVQGNIRTTFDDTTVVNTAVLIMNHTMRLRGIQIRRPDGWKALTLRQDFRWTVPGSIDETSNEMLFIDSSGRELLAPRVPFRGEFQDSGARFPACP